jgi:hypothetical protein
MSTTDDIAEVLDQYGAGITYVPTKSEPSPTEIFPVISSKLLYVIQPIAELDPVGECEKARNIIGEQSAFVLIPGRQFDATGTRHGSGGGWYDRFLNSVPQNWLRIGFCFSEEFSSEALVRELWDEPMDYVCVMDSATRKVTSYQTHARDEVY